MPSFPQYYDDSAEGKPSSKLDVSALAARAVTMASLIVSLAVIKTNNVTLRTKYVVTYKHFTSYKYMFYATVIGLVYTALQIPFALYYMVRKKYLINSPAFLKFDFYADKVVGVVLAIGAGVAFGSTVELRKVNWEEEKIQGPMQDFIRLMYIPAAFLLVGCLSSVISSIHSSLALTKTSS